MKTKPMKKLITGLTLAASCIAFNSVISINYVNAATLVKNVKGYTVQ